MLLSYWRYFDVDPQQLYDIYVESIQTVYGDNSMFMEDLSLFLDEPGACLSVWETQGNAVAALRTEPYMDGYLISCLETAPECRRKGYAEKLVTALFSVQPGVYYAHVDKRNKASLAIHKKLGFTVISDHAVHVDGSVFSNSYTMKR